MHKERCKELMERKTKKFIRKDNKVRWKENKENKENGEGILKEKTKKYIRKDERRNKDIHKKREL